MQTNHIEVIQHNPISAQSALRVKAALSIWWLLDTDTHRCLESSSALLDLSENSLSLILLGVKLAVGQLDSQQQQSPV